MLVTPINSNLTVSFYVYVHLCDVIQSGQGRDRSHQSHRGSVGASEGPGNVSEGERLQREPSAEGDGGEQETLQGGQARQHTP